MPRPQTWVAARFLLALCLVLPWLNGLTAGPLPNFWPLWGAAVLGVAVLVQWRRLDARLMAQAWLAAALLSSLMAALQYFGQAAELAPWVSASETGQAYANLRQRNQFASLSSIGLMCLLALKADAHASKRFGFWPWAGAAVLMALGNAVSSSRTGFLQWVLILAVVLGTWLIQGRRSQRISLAGSLARLSFLAMTSYLFFLFALPRCLLAWQGVEVGSMAERLAGSGQDSRRVLWDNVVHLIAQKPWSGWGWGELDYAHFITAYPGARFSELLDNAHNLPLQLAVELGVPVAIAAGLVFAGLIWRAKPWIERDAGRLLAWGVLALIGVHSLLEYPLWYGPFQWTALFCGLWLWRTPARAPALPAARAPVQTWVFAGLCWSALVVMALDYARVSQLYVPAEDRWPSFRTQPLAHLDKMGGSLFFQREVDFARLVTTPLTHQNAEAMHALALALLHYSPEPRVVEPLIASAIVLGRDDAAALYLSRYRAAFSAALWAQLLSRHPAWSQYLPG